MGLISIEIIYYYFPSIFHILLFYGFDFSLLFIFFYLFYYYYYFSSIVLGLYGVVPASSD